MKYLWRLSMPTWLTDIGFGGHMYRAVSGKVDPRTGEPKSTVGQAWGRIAGVNVYPVEPELTRRNNIKWRSYEIQRYARRMKQRMRDRNLTSEQKRNIRDQHVELIRELQLELRDYRKESKLPDKLKRSRGE